MGNEDHLITPQAINYLFHFSLNIAEVRDCHTNVGKQLSIFPRKRGIYRVGTQKISQFVTRGRPRKLPVKASPLIVREKF